MKKCKLGNTLKDIDNDEIPAINKVTAALKNFKRKTGTKLKKLK